MEEVKPTGLLAKLLDRYKSMGGIIDFVLARPNDWTTPAFDLHEAAAIFTIQVLDKREQEYYREYVAPEYPYLPASNYSFSYDPDNVEGHSIAVIEFLGPYFDIATKRLLLKSTTPPELTTEELKLPLQTQSRLRRERSNHYLKKYFYAGDEEKPETVVTPITKNNKYITEGFAQAFAEPALSLKYDDATSSEIPALELNTLFVSLLTELFDLFESEPIIFQWSDNWSNYFDAGKDYWGSFMWTLQNTSRDYIVGVAASGSMSAAAMMKYNYQTYFLPRKFK